MTKKVAQLVTLSEMGGAQKHVLLLSRELKNRGYDVTIFTSEGGALVDKAIESGIKVEIVKNLVREINPASDAKALKELYRAFKAGGYDIVHCHSSKAGVLGRIAAKLAGAGRIVYTAHGFVFNEPMSVAKMYMYVNMERIGAAFGDKIIAVSRKDFETAIENRITKREKLVFIPNAIPGIDKGSLKEAAQTREELGIKAGEFAIGTVSNFYKTKGHVYLVEAIKRLYSGGYRFKTVFAGQGPEEEAVKKLAGDCGDILFLGYREDNYDIMNALDLFVLPSVKEGMPYVVLEAMSLGKPVLCTKVGALADIITDGVNGYIVEAGESEALYGKLKSIIDGGTEKLNETGMAGKEYADRNFSMSNFMEEIINIYEETENENL